MYLDPKSYSLRFWVIALHTFGVQVYTAPDKRIVQGLYRVLIQGLPGFIQGVFALAHFVWIG